MIKYLLTKQKRLVAIIYKEVKIEIDKKFKENEIINIEIIIEEKTLLNYVFETVWR